MFGVRSLVAAVGACLVLTAASPVFAYSGIRQSGHGRPIYFIGDSWSAGLYADPEHTLAQDAGEDLGMRALVDAQSGTGYVTAPLGTEPYPQRAAAIRPGTHADLIVIQGGSNDDGADPATLLAAVGQTVTAARDALPGATIVLLGPGPDPWPVTETQTVVDRVLQHAASVQHVAYISPLQEGWFTSANENAIIDPGSGHPTIAGDEALGRDLARDLAPLLAARSRDASSR